MNPMDTAPKSDHERCPRFLALHDYKGNLYWEIAERHNDRLRVDGDDVKYPIEHFVGWLPLPPIPSATIETREELLLALEPLNEEDDVLNRVPGWLSYQTDATVSAMGTKRTDVAALVQRTVELNAEWKKLMRGN